LPVAPLGISGHYGLPVQGFVRALEAGVNLLFWEPNYQSMTDFVTRLSGSDRAALRIVAGSFEADGRGIQRDAERALRLLGIERLTLFLLFWVQSWERVAPDVTEALRRLQQTSKVAMFGLSTHSRPLAVEALSRGWNPVMVRHSAAHHGAEAEVLPKALACGASVLTFNNTCYGRLLRPLGDVPSPSAADCYRYSLAQPGVTVCLSAPASLEQLEENLDALRDPAFPPQRREILLAQGEKVYREDAIFRKLVRSL
jgi:aryl-alcohol dehydrogenase-like predicted oxidoreductase